MKSLMTFGFAVDDLAYFGLSPSLSLSLELSDEESCCFL